MNTTLTPNARRRHTLPSRKDKFFAKLFMSGIVVAIILIDTLVIILAS
ncbi:MAG: hypothetical protein IKN11_09325 [Bacteroidales bacterium]|nr:hypothetical protein [Bacteroidales bacterium]